MAKHHDEARAKILRERVIGLDLGRLERDAKDSIARLPVFRQRVIYDYINGLRNKIEYLGLEIDELGEALAKAKER